MSLVRREKRAERGGLESGIHAVSIAWGFCVGVKQDRDLEQGVSREGKGTFLGHGLRRICMRVRWVSSWSKG